jgi:hypothetical protein
MAILWLPADAYSLGEILSRWLYIVGNWVFYLQNWLLLSDWHSLFKVPKIDRLRIILRVLIRKMISNFWLVSYNFFVLFLSRDLSSFPFFAIYYIIS